MKHEIEFGSIEQLDVDGIEVACASDDFDEICYQVMKRFEADEVEAIMQGVVDEAERLGFDEPQLDGKGERVESVRERARFLACCKRMAEL